MTNAEKFKNVFGLYATELWSMPEKEFLEWLNAEKQPERKKGKWRVYEGQCNCDQCKAEFYDMSPFCPNCGADMRAGQE